MNTKLELSLSNKRFLIPGYLMPHLIAFTDKLSSRGFTPLTIRGYFDAVAHFGTWIQKRGVPIKDINYDVVADFSRHRCFCPGGRKKHSVSLKYVKRVKRFVTYLSHKGVIDIPHCPSKILPPSIVVRFCEHMRQRGLARTTIATYEYSILTLLPLLGSSPEKYNTTLIRNVICDFSLQHSCCETKKLTTALRAYLRFLAMEELAIADLDTAVPTVAEWKLSSMPRYIPSNDVERTIDSCDVQTHQGLRDHAIILLLARLGLRAGDIINLYLDDINWSAGSLTVRGKGKTEDRLPLPQDAGNALLAYLEKARPSAPFSQVFLCLNAPHRPFSKSSAISSVVRAALLRAGIANPPSYGAHLLRHSAATALLRTGATLETVASVLRHRSPDMTAYYAKVDIPMLLKIAQPWPEGTSC